MNLQSDDFELFGVPQRFAQDRAALDARWKELQREAHPDKFAAQGAAAQRVAMQWSVRINEAYQRLKDPMRRAAYLCELHGAPIQAEDNTAMPTAFLIQQMEWRESLEEARSAAELDALDEGVQQARGEALALCGQLLDQQADYAGVIREQAEQQPNQQDFKGVAIITSGLQAVVQLAHPFGGEDVNRVLFLERAGLVAGDEAEPANVLVQVLQVELDRSLVAIEVIQPEPSEVRYQQVLR